MAGEDDLSFDINTDVNEADARQSADNLARIFEQAFTRAAPKIGASIAKAIERSFKGKLGADTFDGFAQGARDAADSARFVADSMGRVSDTFENLGAKAKLSADDIRRNAEASEEFALDLDALRKRIEATREALTSVGANPELFAVLDRELDKVLRRSREFNDNLEDISRDSALFAGYEEAFKTFRRIASTELDAGVRELTNLREVQRASAAQTKAVEDRASRERIAQVRQTTSRMVVEQQRETTLRNAEIRTAGQQQIQQERIRARTRIELVRFTFRQIQTLERGIAGVFRATGTVANSAFRSLESATSRISGLFRRSNTDLNQGLIGALRARESSIDRSFDRQTRDIRRSTSEQSAIIQRFETQASTGIAGALSGRSALGSLLGGGLAIGGGFALFQGLRDGLEVGGDFVQGLSVLQAQLELTELQMQGVREQSIALGNDIALPGVSALDAAEAIQILAKQFASLGAGALPAAQAAAEGTLQLARATGVAAEEAARVVGAAVNVFGIEASEAVAVADQVTNALKNAAGVGFNDFADSFTQAASVVNLFIGPAQEANEALAETNAALALLARGGIIGSDAGTSLKQFFLQANRGTVDSVEVLNEVVERAGEMGSVFFDAAGGARTLAESVDILRRGTEGLTDQQFSATLQKLFGSDAARSAAVLIRSTSGELERLTAANLEQGAAAAIAAAQNVGLRGALDALGSVIETQQIKTYEKYQAVLGRVVVRFAELLQAFFEGRGIFEVVRAGLVGIGIGLGALVAAKGAAESVQFLVIALRALVTPLGLIVAGITLVAAAFNILRTVSPDFRQEADRLGETLRDRLGEGLAFVGDGIARLVAFIRTRVIPVFVDFSIAALRFVAPAIEKIGDVANTAILVVDSFVDALTGEGITTERSSIFGIAERAGVAVRILAISVDAFIRTLAGQDIELIDNGEEDTLTDLQNAAVGVATAIRGVGTAAVEVAKQVGTIGDGLLTLATTGDFTPLRDRIVSAFRGLGTFVIDEVTPQLRAIIGFIDNFLSLGGGLGGTIGAGVQAFLLGPFQTAANELGRFLGNLITDPRLVQALEKLVGLAILTGANFVAGFAEGVASNVDELADLIGGQIFGALQAGVVAAFRAPNVVAAAIVAAFFGPTLVRLLRRPVDDAGKRVGDGFARSFSERVRAATRSNAFASGFFGGAAGIERSATRAAQRAGDAMIREQLRAIERLQLLNQRIQVGPGPNQFKTATDQWEAYSKRVGTAEIAGASFRTSLGRIFTDVGNFARAGSIAVSTSYRDGFSAAGTAARSFTTNVRQLIQNSIADFRTAGIGVGQALGGSIVAGVGAALAGQQLGTADSGFGKGLGLAGIISAAIFGAAAVGGGPQGLVVGGLIATIGLASAAMARSGEAAKLAAERIKLYAEALREADTAAEQLGGVSEIVNDQVETLDEFGIKILQLAKFDVAAFSNAVLNGASALDALDAATPGLSAAQFDEAFKGAKGYDDILRIVNDSQSEILAGMRLANAQRFFNRNLEGDVADVATSADAAATALNAAVDAAGGFGSIAVDALVAGLGGGLAGAAEQAEQNLSNIQQALNALDQQRTSNIQGQIDELTGQLELARGAAQAARDNLTAFLSGDYVDTAQEALDNLLLGLPGIASQLDDALTLTPTLQEAQLNQTLSGFGQSAATAIQRGIDEGLVDLADPASVRTALAPFFTAIDELVARGVGQDENGVSFGGITPEAGERLRTQLEGLISGDTFALLLEDIAVKDEAASALQTQINDLGIELGVNVVFSRRQIQAAADALGLTINLNALPQQIPTAVTDAIPGVSRSEQVTLANAQSQARADAEADRNALSNSITEAIRAGASADTGERIGVNVENLNVNGSTTPVAAGAEVVLALGAVAGGLSGATRREVLPILAGSRS